MRARERRGISIEVVPSDSTGQIDLDALERSVDDDVALIALTHVPTNGGLVNPAAAVGRIARSVGVPFLLDACQSVGQLDIDVEALGCDLLSATGRKYLRGPRGTGFLYASDRIIDTLHPDHPDHHGAHWDRPDGYTLSAGAARFEHWEYSHASWLGLGPAVELATSIGMGRVEATIRQQAARLRKQLHEAGCETFDLGEQPCGIVTTTVAGRDPAAVKAALREQHINVSVSSPSSTLWDATRRQLQPMLRVSVHYLTTDDEIDQTVEALKNQR
jgi:selenocysteine lyase/cysteine desulfurase